jgi:ADP-L-glycero-D-manno-heptose 6-epimerase
MAYYKFDFVFHLAAISNTRIFDQEIVLKRNINSFYDLLVIAKKDRAVMVYASSVA